MTDLYDRATEREEAQRADALERQERAAGLVGKTVADSATHCHACEARIPEKRRKAVPGVQTCIDCQQELEAAINRNHPRSHA